MNDNSGPTSVPVNSNVAMASEHTPTRGHRSPLVPSGLATIPAGNTSFDSSPGSGTNSPGSPWVNTVGPASLGRSGRVLEQVSADRDKLKRELNVEKEEKKQLKEEAKARNNQFVDLKDEMDKMRLTENYHTHKLSRQDRIIAELKEKMDAQKLLHAAELKAALEKKKRELEEQIAAKDRLLQHKLKELDTALKERLEALEQCRELKEDVMPAIEKMNMNIIQLQREQNDEWEFMEAKVNDITQKVKEEVREVKAQINHVIRKQTAEIIEHKYEADRMRDEARSHKKDLYKQEVASAKKLTDALEETQWLHTLVKKLLASQANQTDVNRLDSVLEAYMLIEEYSIVLETKMIQIDQLGAYFERSQYA